MVNWLSKKVSAKTGKDFLNLSHEEKVEKRLESIISMLVIMFVFIAGIAMMLIPLLFK